MLHSLSCIKQKELWTYTKTNELPNLKGLGFYFILDSVRIKIIFFPLIKLFEIY